MRGVGEVLSAPLDLPQLPAVLVNPGVALATRDVFGNFAPQDSEREASPMCRVSSTRLIEFLDQHRNDLTEAAVACVPVDRRSARRPARLAGQQARAHVRFGADLLCAVWLAAEAAAAAGNCRSEHKNWWVWPRRWAVRQANLEFARLCRKRLALRGPC